MDLRPTQMSEITAMREKRRRALPLGLVPGFYERLVGEATPHVLEEPDGAGTPPRGLGYALLLERPHNGHTHVTVVEVYLEPQHHLRFEQALDLLREKKGPTTFLARTDDCAYNAMLLARGLQVEPTALVLLAADRAGSTAPPDPTRPTMELSPFAPGHLEELRALLRKDRVKDAGNHPPDDPHDHSHDHPHDQSHDDPQDHSHGPRREPTTDELLADLERMAASGRDWVILADASPVAVIARADGGDGVHELLDIALGMAPEADLAEGLRRASGAIMSEGFRPAAVIDALETTRHRLFRAAGFHTAAAYLVFYDPEAGRPSVARVTTEELRSLLNQGAQVRLVDVMGEEHWRQGHIPGAEWIEFRGLAREARSRYRPDEPIILYCNGFT